jgi:iron complex transport system substrate-binding protein
MKHLCILIFIIAVLLSSCGGHSARHQGDGDTVVFRYAQRLSVVRYKGYTIATLANPWKKGKILHQYLLVPKNGELPESLPHGCTIVRTPLQRSVVFTTVHCALLQMLHRESSIAGVADLKYIKIPFVHEAVDKGRIADVGDGMSPVVEKIIDLGPDALLLSPFENSGGYGRLEEIDIPIIECAEYMEPTPLARAEWMRFYGMLYGCEQEADSLFAVVDRCYHAMKQLAATSTLHPTCVLDKVTGSVWYVPGGQSTIGRMIRDAGGRYPWAADEHSGSVSLPFETVLDRAGECDVWLFRFSSDHLISYKELLGEHHGYDQFKAFREHQAYGCNVELSQFYEESPFRPDYLLGDFINILHSDIPDLPPLRYYQKLHE